MKQAERKQSNCEVFQVIIKNTLILSCFTSFHPGIFFFLQMDPSKLYDLSGPEVDVEINSEADFELFLASKNYYVSITLPRASV